MLVIIVEYLPLYASTMSFYYQVKCLTCSNVWTKIRLVLDFCPVPITVFAVNPWPEEDTSEANLHWWLVPARSPRHSPAGWRTGRGSWPEPSSQTSPRTAVRRARCPRNPVSVSRSGGFKYSPKAFRHSGIRIMITIIVITCVSGSRVKSFRRASLLILDSMSLAVCWNKGRQTFTLCRLHFH